MSELSDYLTDLRLSKKPKRSRKAISRQIKAEYQGTRAVDTICDDIYQFEKGLSGLQDALSRTEPHITIFLLYVKKLNPDEEHMKKIEELILRINPDFYS